MVQGQATVPSTLGDELDTNPFLRPDDPAIRKSLGERYSRQQHKFDAHPHTCSCCIRCIVGDNLQKLSLLHAQYILPSPRLHGQVKGLKHSCCDVQECLKKHPVLMPLLQSGEPRMSSEGECAV